MRQVQRQLPWSTGISISPVSITIHVDVEADSDRPRRRGRAAAGISGVAGFGASTGSLRARPNPIRFAIVDRRSE